MKLRDAELLLLLLILSRRNAAPAGEWEPLPNLGVVPLPPNPLAPPEPQR